MKSNFPEIEPRIIEVKTTRTEGVKPYDEDNLYPQRIDSYIKSSGTATSCVNLLARFIRGKGSADKNFYKSRVNTKGLKVDQLVRFYSNNIARFGYAVFHINYNALGEKISITPIPSEWARFGAGKEHTGKIAIYDDWEFCKRAYDIKNVNFYNFYNPLTVLEEIAEQGIENYKGQVLFYSPMLGEYPLCPCDAVIEDVITDGGIKDFRLRQVTTSFIGSHIIEYPYEFQSEEEREDEKENWKNFQGTSNANKLVVVENPNAEKTAIKIHKLDIQNNDKLFEVTNRTCKDSIIESFGQPPQLLGVSVAGKLGTADEIRDAYDFYNSFTEDERIQLEELLVELFHGWYYNINPSGNYSIIPLSFGTTNNNIGL